MIKKKPKEIYICTQFICFYEYICFINEVSTCVSIKVSVQIRNAFLKPNVPVFPSYHALVCTGDQSPGTWIGFPSGETKLEDEIQERTHCSPTPNMPSVPVFRIELI